MVSLVVCLPVPAFVKLFVSQVLTKDELMKVSGKKTNRELLVPCFQLKDTDHEGWMTKQGGPALCLLGVNSSTLLLQ